MSQLLEIADLQADVNELTLRLRRQVLSTADMLGHVGGADVQPWLVGDPSTGKDVMFYGDGGFFLLVLGF